MRGTAVAAYRWVSGSSRVRHPDSGRVRIGERPTAMRSGSFAELADVQLDRPAGSRSARLGRCFRIRRTSVSPGRRTSGGCARRTGPGKRSVRAAPSTSWWVGRAAGRSCQTWRYLTRRRVLAGPPAADTTGLWTNTLVAAPPAGTASARGGASHLMVTSLGHTGNDMPAWRLPFVPLAQRISGWRPRPCRESVSTDEPGSQLTSTTAVWLRRRQPVTIELSSNTRRKDATCVQW